MKQGERFEVAQSTETTETGWPIVVIMHGETVATIFNLEEMEQFLLETEWPTVIVMRGEIVATVFILEELDEDETTLKELLEKLVELKRMKLDQNELAYEKDGEDAPFRLLDPGRSFGKFHGHERIHLLPQKIEVDIDDFEFA